MKRTTTARQREITTKIEEVAKRVFQFSAVWNTLPPMQKQLTEFASQLPATEAMS
jgi:hypothetical protein